ncbi:hypothetical protein JCM5296_003091 [Sporobolomyces johnsonii]
MSTWSRLVRFHPRSSPTSTLVGEPIDPSLDVGLAAYEGKEIEVDVYEGSSILKAGEKTGRREVVERLLSPVGEDEVGTIRCIGLNYAKHAQEAKLDIPSVPVVFLKPSTTLAGPWPDRIVVPKFTIPHESADYESELGVIIGRDCKDVSEDVALDYVLGYTATNDVSSRKSQFETSQWSFSKGFDKACPAGPCVVSAASIPDPSSLYLRGLKNDEVLQESPLTDLIFSIPKIISFLSQGTTLKAGTLILTGTPAGVGTFFDPPAFLRDGDVFRVELSGGIGSLVNVVEYEK